MGDTAKVSFDGKAVELPILKGTDGPAVVDIRKLYAEADVAEAAAGRALEILRSLGACDSPVNIDGKGIWAGMAGELEFKELSEASRHIWQKLAGFGGFPEGFGADRVAHAELDTALPRRCE